MKSVAVITARGGSKRIPRKNVKEFCGKPIMAYSIEAAVSSGIFEQVMVSTEDEEIAQIAQAYGAHVPFLRSKEKADDFATTADVLLEVIEEYEKRNLHFDALCCLYPTAPFVTGEKLKRAKALLEEKGADSVVPVVRFEFPPQRGFVMKEDCLHYRWPEYALCRSQDLDPFYHDAGQFYFLKTKSFLLQRTLVMQKTIPLVLPEMEVQDIDTAQDWAVAELKYRLLKGEC